MSKITTDDCKKYLIEEYKKKGAITQEKNWKRTKKYKREDGLWIRDFSHDAIGNVSLVEDANGLLSIMDLSNIKSTSQIKNKSQVEKSFDLTVFSKNEIKNAWSVYKKYYDACDEEEDASEDPGSDEFVLKYDNSIRSIPGILSWYVSPEAYENYELENKKITWDFNMKGFNVFMFDHKNYHEYGGDEHLLQKYLPKYFSKMDEYHYEIIADVTVEQLVHDLSILGYSYVNSHVGEECSLKKLMKKVEFNKVEFIISPLENDIASGNIQKYSVTELNGQKISNQSVAMYVFNNKKYDIFNHLIDNKIEITNEEISLVISKNYMEFYNDQDMLNGVMRILTEYEHINLDTDGLEKITYVLQHSNQNNLLLSLLPKYGTQENILSFVSHSNISTDINVLPHLINRFSKKDDELKQWIDSYFIYGKNLALLDNKAVRDALTRTYLVSILDNHHDEYLEDLRYEANRSNNGMMIIETSLNGVSQSWLDKKTQSVAQFIQIKNKILSYFDKNDDEPKPKYRTKF